MSGLNLSHKIIID